MRTPVDESTPFFICAYVSRGKISRSDNKERIKGSSNNTMTKRLLHQDKYQINHSTLLII